MSKHIRGNLTTKDAIQNYAAVLEDSKKMFKKMRSKDFDYDKNKYEIQNAFFDLMFVSNLMLCATREFGRIEDGKYKS